MKTRTILLLLCLLALPMLGVSAYQAVLTPLPDGFPPPSPSGKIEVKQYPTYRCATYHYDGQLSQVANVAFGPLYSHISANHIAMTAPVVVRYARGAQQPSLIDPLAETGHAAVSFLFRNRQLQPQQLAPGVEVEEPLPMTVVSIGVRGAYTFTSYQQSLKQLSGWLEWHHNYQVGGQPRRLFYDSPFIPDAFKRSDVQIPVMILRRRVLKNPPGGSSVNSFSLEPN